MDDEMANIVSKLAKFVMPADRNALDYLVVKKMTYLATVFSAHIQAKVPPLLNKLPDETMMDLESHSVSKTNKHLLQITYQFKSEKEPWNFNVNMALLKNYMGAFKEGDQYLVKKLDLMIRMLDFLTDEKKPDAEKAGNVIALFTEAATVPALLTHRKDLRFLFNDVNQPASEKFVEDMMSTIDYANKMAVIMEPVKGNNAAATAQRKV
jgi:hypothetical protein